MRMGTGMVLGTAGQSMLFTLVGSAGLIVAAFLDWIRPEGIRGIDVGYRAFYRTNFSVDATFLRSAGAVSIMIGILAILGLASRAGWITRLAGALGIIAFALFTITLYRADFDLPRALGPGMWVMLGGALVTMFGGFFATRPRVVVTNTTE
ncbi:MAG: hypothetical protein WAT66_14770 [Actinomycetota bacterium]